MSQPVRAPHVTLIHAVQAAMGPIEAAFQRSWPSVRRGNLLDDALPDDLQRAGDVMTPDIMGRIGALTDYAVSTGTAGILFTCSAFGEAIEAAARRVGVPVLKPNEAMFQAALDSGRRIGMLATFSSSVGSMEQEFRALAEARGIEVTLETICVADALAAAKRGDIALHDRLVAAAAPGLAHCDAVMLAHFSTSTALEPVRRVLACPVLSATDAAVASLKARVADRCDD